MRNLSKLALTAVLAAGLAGTAAAAEHKAPLVIVDLPDPVFVMPDFDSLFADMDRQMAAAMQQIDELGRRPVAVSGPEGVSAASFGSLPAGTTSYSSMTTVIDNGRQCSRSTEVIGQGPGKAPKVLSKVSGDCGPAQAQVQPQRQQQQPVPVVAVPDGPIHQS